MCDMHVFRPKATYSTKFVGDCLVICSNITCSVRDALLSMKQLSRALRLGLADSVWRLRSIPFSLYDYVCKEFHTTLVDRATAQFPKLESSYRRKDQASTDNLTVEVGIKNLSSFVLQGLFLQYTKYLQRLFGLHYSCIPLQFAM